MAYDATDDFGGVDETRPLGSEPPSVVDDAAREVRRVAKAVISNAHTTKGALRIAFLKQSSATAVDSLALGAWKRRVFNTIEDPTGLVTVGTYLNTYKPQLEGYYFIEFWAACYQTDKSQARIATPNSDTASTPISNLFSSVAYSNDGGIEANATMFGAGSFQQDSGITKEICMDQLVEKTNSAGWGMAAPTGGGASVSALVKITYLGKKL